MTIQGIPSSCPDRAGFNAYKSMASIQILEFSAAGRCKTLESEFCGDYIRRLSERDPETDRHFARHFEPLLRVRLQHRFRDNGRADDIAQETLLRVLKTVRKHPGSIDQPDRLGAYVNSICSHVISEGFRGDSRDKVIGEAQLDRADPSMDIERSLLSAERQTMVRTVLYALAPKDRLLLTEVFLEEQDRAEVCTRHGVDRQYLRVMLFRALGRFRIELGKKV